jgi:hypothetical protein
MVVSTQSKQSLSLNKRQLLLLMQRLNFGRIEGLKIRNGEPVLDPPPRVVREVKFGGENGPRAEAGTDDFLLKSQVVDLFRQLEMLRDCTVCVLVVKHGLPFGMEMEANAA